MGPYFLLFYFYLTYFIQRLQMSLSGFYIFKCPNHQHTSKLRVAQ